MSTVNIKLVCSLWQPNKFKEAQGYVLFKQVQGGRLQEAQGMQVNSQPNPHCRIGRCVAIKGSTSLEYRINTMILNDGLVALSHPELHADLERRYKQEYGLLESTSNKSIDVAVGSMTCADSAVHEVKWD